MATPDRDRSRLLGILAIAVALRLAVALASIGTNDVGLWQRFGRGAMAGSFFDLWRVDPWMNHPPLTVCWAWLCYTIAGEHRYPFALLLKLPGLAGDVGATWLIARLRRDAWAGRAALLYALNPTAILVSGYHGNVDSLLGALTLATWAAASRGRWGWAGLALGAAINVKLSPAPSVALLLTLAAATSPRALAHATAGLAVAAAPFAVMVAGAGRPFLDATLAYRPLGYPWLMLVPARYLTDPTFGSIATFTVMTHAATAVYAAFLWAAVIVWRRVRTGRPGDLVAVGALYGCGFLLWEGGAFQYLAWPLATLACARPRLAFAYGVGGAAWLTWAYADAWTGGFPLESYFSIDGRQRSAVAICLPVLALAAAVVSLWREQSPAHPTVAEPAGGR